MATQADDRGPAEQDGDATASGYDAFIKAKVAKALVQSRDRSAMIAIEDVWRDFKVNVALHQERLGL